MTNTGSVIRRSAAALGAGVAALLLSAAPAYAHYNSISVTGGYAAINSGHSAVSVCRQSSYYDYIEAQIKFSDGTTSVFRDFSNNGACNSFSLNKSAASWRLCGRWDGGGSRCTLYRSA